MKWQEEHATDSIMVPVADIVELHLPLSARQHSALEAAAARLEMTVAALLHRTIADLLRPRAPGGLVGEVAGRPGAPLVEFYGFH
ncbi:hypothetical protein [Frigoriglobus tundricola]|nr:hypothetical protein [Frigoriglobus tundricola]